jgi:DNA-binding transcriptional ArsR family regulator
MTAIEVLRDPARAANLLQPERLRVLENLLEPDSASGVARRLQLPRQQVNYHLRELEKCGLVEFIEERRRGNCLERLVQATARSYLISPDALGRLGRDPALQPDRFSAAYLLAAAARAIREVARLLVRADKAGKRVATLTLETEVRFADAAARSAFAEELTNAVARLAAKYNTDRPGGRRFRFFLGAYPAAT